MAMWTNLQNMFLDYLCEHEEPITIVMPNGAQIKGVMKAHDTYTLVLETQEEKQILVYKQCIATIVPDKKLTIISNSQRPESKEKVQKKESKQKEKQGKANSTLEQGIKKVKLEEIRIPKSFLKTQPSREKVEKFKQQYQQTGNFEGRIKVKENTMTLVDGYARYMAAKELGLEEIEVEIVG